MSDWRVDDIDQDLAADFDDSLSGLGVELGTSSYNMRYVFTFSFVVIINYVNLLGLIIIISSSKLNIFN